MEKLCFLAERNDSLFKQLVAGLLMDLSDHFELCENKAIDFRDLLSETKEAGPKLILLDDPAPFSENSLMTRVLVNLPDIPVIVISEDSNLMYIVRCETRLLSSSRDLIEAINLLKA